MTADVLKEGGYVIVGSGGAGGSVDSRGYAVAGVGDALVRTNRANVAFTHGGAASTVNTQVVLANPAVITSSATYILFANEPGVVLTAPGYVVLQPFYPPYEDLGIDFTFMEERFPECVSYGSQGGPGFRTSVFEFDSGFTATEIEWERLRARYDANFENVTPADVEEVEDFFYGMKGRAIGFRYKDWSDYQITSQNVGIGDGTSTAFQVFKRYVSGGFTFDRIIKKTVTGTSQVRLDGVGLLEGGDYFMLDAQGQIVFPTPPAAGSIISIDYLEYDVPVRFDSDFLNVSYRDFRQLEMSIPMIEVLV